MSAFSDESLVRYCVQVVEDAKQGPDVPDDLNPRQLKPVGIIQRKGGIYLAFTSSQHRPIGSYYNTPYGRKLLWWLFNHSDLIPQEWEQVPYIVFPGDYDLRGRDGRECVLYMDHQQRAWDWHCYWLGSRGREAIDRVLTPCQI